MSIPEGYAQVTYRFGGSSAPTGAAVTHGILVTGGDDPETIATDAGNRWASEMASVVVNTLLLVDVLVKFGPDATGPSAVVAANFPGLAGAAGTSPAVSFLIRKNTSFGGRAGRGRMYHPGVNEPAVNTSGEILAASVLALQAAADDWLGSWVTAGNPWVLLHQAGSPLTEPSIVTSLSVQSVVATQRRRQRR
jgi:hypothetical protein